MKKNLKNCVDVYEQDEAQVLLDMNQYEMIEGAGMEPDLHHKKSAYVSAAWRFSQKERVTVRLGKRDLSEFRYLTFSVFAVGGAGGSFRLMFDMDAQGDGQNGYEVTLPLSRDGWNSYRIELPFLRSVGQSPTWSEIGSICFDCVAGGQANRADTVLYFDNLFIWKHFAPPLYASMPELKGAAVFSRCGSFSIVDRKRIANTPDGSDARPFEKDGTVWLPMSPVAAGIAHSAVVDNLALTLSFTYRRKKYVFSANHSYMTVGEDKQELGFYPAVRGGTLFFPADFVRTFFHWRQIFVDPVGLVVLSNRKHVFDSARDSETIWQLIADCTFVRPGGERILNDLHKRFPNPTRGRLLASHDELMRLRRQVKEGGVQGDYAKLLKERYGIGTSAFANGIADGALTEGALAQLAERIISFALLFRVTGEKQYAERTAEECEALASMSDWEVDGSAAGTGMLSLAVAIGYDWCHHVWSEGRKALIERGMLRNGMRPCLEAYDGKRRMWRLGSVTGAVINAGALAMSMSLADIYPQTALRLLDCVLRNTEPCFASYAPDGGFAESVTAWEKSCRSLSLMIAMLRTACGSSYGLENAPGFLPTAYFPIHAETAGGAWNYHNCAPDAVDTAALSILASIGGDTVPAWLRRRQILSGRKAVSPFDLLFYTSVDDSAVPSLPLDAVYRKAGLCMMRSGWKRESVFAGLHAGKNREIGGDLDVGAFVLEMDGERFFAETGGVPELDMLLRRRAEGQNTLTVGDISTPSLPDQKLSADARITEMRSSLQKAYAVIDMTSTSDAILRARRGLLLTQDRSVAVIQDELTLSQVEPVVWRAWTQAQIKLNPSGRVARLTQNGKTLICRLCGVGSPARFEVRESEQGGFRALTVRVEGKEKIRMAVACRMLRDGMSATERFYEVVPISRWSEIE